LGYDPKKYYPPVKMIIMGFKTHTEGAGATCKKYGVYEIEVTQGTSVWRIFRRYQQCYDLDAKLKENKLVPKDDKTLPPKTMGKRDNTEQAVRERALGLELYFAKVLNLQNVRNSPYFYNFVGPFQIGDKTISK